MTHKHFIRSSYEFLKLGTRKSKDQIKKLYTGRRGKVVTAWRNIAQSCMNFSRIASTPGNNLNAHRFRTKPV